MAVAAAGVKAPAALAKPVLGAYEQTYAPRHRQPERALEPRGRPSSAPPVRSLAANGAAAFPGGDGRQRAKGPNQVARSMQRAQSGRLSAIERAEAFARVAEKRHVTQSGYWGINDNAKFVRTPKRDLPAFWSVASHGQPFNDERLTETSNYSKVVAPKELGSKADAPSGPASESLSSLRNSLQHGFQLYDKKDLSPKSLEHSALSTLRSSQKTFRADPNNKAAVDWAMQSAAKATQLAILSDAEREWLILRLPVHYRIHALANCWDSDEHQLEFLPWTFAFDRRCDRVAWVRDRGQCLRLGTAAALRMMRLHLTYLSEQECTRARAPYKLKKDVLRHAMWRVDPRHTGFISMPQFMQVWQNILQLWEYKTEDRVRNGKVGRVLVPLRRRIVDRNATAAIFVKFGFDKNGFMPYEVFIHALNETPSRLLGHELILDNKHNGVVDNVDVAMLLGDAKVKYPKTRPGVFPPSGFDERLAERSQKLPRAHMWLEHVYGYNGMSNTANNIFYTKYTSLHLNEIVYYCGMVGIVATWVQDENTLGVRQRFFFGHDNDIMCIAIHPNRRFVATGQQKNTGKAHRPYVCIWDIGAHQQELVAGKTVKSIKDLPLPHDPVQLQRIEVEPEFRAILAVAFSGNGDKPYTPACDERGGELLITISGDNNHTVHIWYWMLHKGPMAGSTREADKIAHAHIKAMHIPSWYYGPSSRLPALEHGEKFYCAGSDDPDGPKRHVPEEQPYPTAHLDWDNIKVLDPDASEVVPQLTVEFQANNVKAHPLVAAVLHDHAHTRPSQGFAHPDSYMSAPDGTYMLIQEEQTFQGTPPAVYGVAFNPLRPSSGLGCEFLTYGIKHLKSWVQNDSGRFEATNASFGPDRVQNVLSAIFVPAMHQGRSKGDSCIVTGFSDGSLGLWVPPFPTKAGSTYVLTKVYSKAHEPGPLLTLVDGSQQFGGVRCLKLRQPDSDGNLVLLSGGADGRIRKWLLLPSQAVRSDGLPPRGARLEPYSGRGQSELRVQMPSLPQQEDQFPMISGLDAHASRDDSFVAGTNGSDIWEVDATMRTVVDGHTGSVDMVAPHPDPALAHMFVTADESGTVLIWNAQTRCLFATCLVGFKCCAVDISKEMYARDDFKDWQQQGPAFKSCYHVAVAGVKGRIMIMQWDDLRPLAQIPAKGTKEGICDLKFTPAGGPKLLAAASRDQNIYIYSVAKGYQLQATCRGPSGTVEHLDWSFPVVDGPISLQGRYLLQSNDGSREILHWDGKTGKKVVANQRDCMWSTWTCPLGFPVLGIWPDDADGTDVNSVCRSSLGAPKFDKASQMPVQSTARESADNLPSASYIATADDFSTVKLFNGPVVADDAPFRAYRGHASHVSCVRFAADDRWLFSVGGHDQCVFQWRTIGINVDDQKRDRWLLKAVEEAAFYKHQSNRENVPQPREADDSWVQNDKTWGPKPNVELKQKADLKRSLTSKSTDRRRDDSSSPARGNSTLRPKTPS